MERTRETTISLGLAITLVLLLAAFSAQALLPGPVLAAEGDRLPNLKMVPLHEWHIQTVNGRRLLRFTTIMANRGPGAFEVRGHRTRQQNRMAIDQVIFKDSGAWRRVGTGAVGRYAGDGHDHWHVQRIMTYELYRVANPSTVRGGAKTGFCFLDTTPWRLRLPYARRSPYYQEEWCGSRATLTNRIGISVGWGDRYPWDFAYQWIDITGLPAGRYVVRSTVDIANDFRETNNFDNCAWARIRIRASGSQVTVLDSGTDCGRDAVTAVSTFPGAKTYDPPRLIEVAAGRHTGYAFNHLGTQLRATKVSVDSPMTLQTSARAAIPGRSGRWFHVLDGPWAGYWLRDTARVNWADPG
jgi:Lysyl oxidase